MHQFSDMAGQLNFNLFKTIIVEYGIPYVEYGSEHMSSCAIISIIFFSIFAQYYYSFVLIL